MLQGLYVFGIFLGCLLTMNVANPDGPRCSANPPVSIISIFQPPNNSDVSQISNTCTPWVIPDLIPTIQEFKMNVLEGLQASPIIQKIWDSQIDRGTARAILFNVTNDFLSQIGHPVPAALSNVFSKAASLFHSFTFPAYFEAKAIALAQFLLSMGIEISHNTAQSYVSCIVSALESVDTSNAESVVKALFDGYTSFIASFGFQICDVIDTLTELFASEFIVLYDKNEFAPLG